MGTLRFSQHPFYNFITKIFRRPENYSFLVIIRPYKGRMSEQLLSEDDASRNFGNRVKSAVIWRSGMQILSQVITWAATLIVLRLLDPSDYGVFAITHMILVFLNFLAGYGFVSAIVQDENLEEIRIRQAFGILILLNGGLAIAQYLIVAPLAAHAYGNPLLADIIRWQALIYISTPFIILPEALMTRELNFRKPALLNALASIITAATALLLAAYGYGVWALVFAPLAGFWSRAILLVLFTGFRIWPSFNFRGSGNIFTFGSTLLLGHCFWVIQSQSDTIIAGRSFTAHELGIYAEAMFLTTVFAAKFVPPLNDVAFPAYARLQNNKSAMAYGFLKAVRLIMLVACPLYIGMSVTAGPFVETIMGPKWIEAIPLVQILALAMPFMTLQILFNPVFNAIGKPQLTMLATLAGAIIMPLSYWAGHHYGPIGLAYAWLVAMPCLLIFTIWLAHKHIDYTLTELASSIWPGLSCALLMGGAVWLVNSYLIIPTLKDAPDILKLFLLSGFGALVYVALLFITAKSVVLEVTSLILQKQNA